MQVTYPFTNRKGLTLPRTDTISFRYIKKEVKKVKGKEVKPKMEVICNIGVSPKLDLNKTLAFTFQFPIDSIDVSKILFSKKKDTTWILETFRVKKDTGNYRTWDVQFKNEENKEYKLVIPAGTFMSKYNISHDTIQSNFHTEKLEYYANISVVLSHVKMPMILQLLSNEKVIRELRTKKDGKLTFDYLEQGDYSFKLIYDRNNNGVWDTGNLLQKIQPEKIDIYKQKQTVRSNSEYEIDWDVK